MYKVVGRLDHVANCLRVPMCHLQHCKSKNQLNFILVFEKRKNRLVGKESIVTENIRSWLKVYDHSRKYTVIYSNFDWMIMKFQGNDRIVPKFQGSYTLADRIISVLGSYTLRVNQKSYLNNFDAAPCRPTITANNKYSVVDQASACFWLAHTQLCNHCPLVKIWWIDFRFHYINTLVNTRITTNHVDFILNN